VLESSSSGEQHWIFSKHFDLAIFLIPLGLAALSPLSLLLGPMPHIPLWAFVLFIAAFDVAHVWATVYRTYLDHEELIRRWRLYLVPIPFFLYLSFQLHYHSSVLFWTILAYVAIFHFVKQNYGFVALYRVRKRERSTFDYRLDKWTVWVGALGPVLWWHATPMREFDWFNAGESFVLRLPLELMPLLNLIYGLTVVVYIGRQIQRKVCDGFVNPGKNLIMAAHFVTWAVGIRLTSHPLISAAFLNLFHGIPFIAIIWYYCNRKWEDGESSARTSQLVQFLSRKKNWFLFFLVIFVPALVEETLWDWLVWERYLPQFLSISLPSLNHFALSVAVAVLSLPQIMHYYLDAYIWKFDGSNPDLATHLNLRP
jgi:hypothetical protein